MKPLKLSEIAAAVGGELNQSLLADTLCYGVSFDTRSIEKGMLFVPIRGVRDGHDFLAQAVEKGAVCVFSEIETNLPTIYVKDAKRAMGDLAAHYIGLFPHLKVVGITGSCGKTSTKDMIGAVCSQVFNIVKTIGNFNNDIGMPITIFDIDEDTEVAVLEMGMNNRHEISRLSKIARPDIAVITNIGVAHIENLGSREEIFNAKSELFDGLKPNGAAFLHGDDDFLPRHKSRENTWFYGDCALSSYIPQNVVDNGLDGHNYDVVLRSGEKVSICVPAPGLHMLTNSLAAVAVGEHLGMTGEEIAAGIAAYKPTGMRMDVRKNPSGMRIIADCYNANPDSMLAALEVLAAEKSDRGAKGVVAVLGDMRELGEDCAKMHYQIGEKAAKLGIDKIVAIGQQGAVHIFRGAADARAHAIHFDTKENFLRKAQSLLSPEDTVLVKASRGMRFEDIVEFLEKI